MNIEKKEIISNPQEKQQIAITYKFFGWTLQKDVDKQEERSIQKTDSYGKKYWEKIVEVKSYMTFARRLDNPNIDKLKMYEINYPILLQELEQKTKILQEMEKKNTEQQKNIDLLEKGYKPKEAGIQQTILVAVATFVIFFIVLLATNNNWLFAFIPTIIVSLLWYFVIFTFLIYPKISQQEYIDKKTLQMHNQAVTLKDKLSIEINAYNELMQSTEEKTKQAQNVQYDIAKMMDGYWL